MMKEIIDFLTVNHGLFIWLLVLATIVVAIVIVAAGSAFLDGRSVDLWIFKVGAAEAKKDKEDKSKSSSSEISHPSGFVKDYVSAHLSDADLMSKVTASMDFMGISSQFLYTREGFLDFVCNRAISMRFLLLDPCTNHAKNLEVLEGIPVRRNIVTSTKNLLDLASKNPRISIKFYDKEPVLRIINIDKKMSFVGYYGATQNNPCICFEIKQNGRSFVFPMFDLFERTWDGATLATHEILKSFEEKLKDEQV